MTNVLEHTVMLFKEWTTESFLKCYILSYIRGSVRIKFILIIFLGSVRGAGTGPPTCKIGTFSSPLGTKVK